MVDTSHFHAISKQLEKKLCNDRFREDFFTIMSIIVNMQIQMNKRFKLLQLNINDSAIFLNVHTIKQSYLTGSSQIINDICRMCATREVFDAIAKLTNSKRIIKSVPVKLRPLVSERSEQEQYVKFANMIAIVNTIKHRLTGKTQYDVVNYRLFEQLTDMVGFNVNDVQLLLRLSNAPDTDKLARHMSTYNYNQATIEHFMDTLTDEQYQQLYSLFDNFI